MSKFGLYFDDYAWEPFKEMIRDDDGSVFKKIREWMEHGDTPSMAVTLLFSCFYLEFNRGAKSDWCMVKVVHRGELDSCGNTHTK